MFERIKSCLLYDGLVQSEYTFIEGAIIKENNRRLVIYNYVAAIVIFCLFIASLFNPSLSAKTFIYLFGVLSNIVMLILLKSKASQSILISKVINYYFVSLMLLFTIYVGTVASGGLPASTFFTCLAIAPYITYSKVLWGFVHRLIAVILFIVFSYVYKPVEYFNMDVINAVVVFVISSVAGAYFQRLQVGVYTIKNNMDLELKHMSKMFEKIMVISLKNVKSVDYSVYSKDVREISEKNDDAIALMDDFIENYVCEKNREAMRQFCDLTTLEDRMFEKEVLEKDYVSVEGMMERVIMVTLEADSNGFPTKVAFTIKRLADPYYIRTLELDVNRIP